jgi:hypothetical protein
MFTSSSFNNRTERESSLIEPNPSKSTSNFVYSPSPNWKGLSISFQFILYCNMKYENLDLLDDILLNVLILSKGFYRWTSFSSKLQSIKLTFVFNQINRACNICI